MDEKQVFVSKSFKYFEYIIQQVVEFDDENIIHS